MHAHGGMVPLRLVSGDGIGGISAFGSSRHQPVELSHSDPLATGDLLLAPPDPSEGFGVLEQLSGQVESVVIGRYRRHRQDSS